MSFKLKRIQLYVADIINRISAYLKSFITQADNYIQTYPLKAFLYFVAGVIFLRLFFIAYREIVIRRDSTKPKARSRIIRFLEFNMYYLFLFFGLDIFNVYLESFNKESFIILLHIFRNILVLYVIFINIGYFHSYLNYNFKVYFKKGNRDFINDSRKLRYKITLSTFFFLVLYNLFSGFLGHNIITIIFFVIFTKIIMEYEKYAVLILPKVIPTSIMLTKKHVPKTVIRYILPIFLYIYTLLYSFYLMFFLAFNNREWARSLLSGILEQHLENLRDEAFSEYSPPQDYIDQFMREDEIQIIRKPDPAALAYERIDAWLNGAKSTYHLAFSGESGSGKNHILNKVLNRYSSVNSFNVEIVEKIIEESVLIKRLESFIGDGSDEEKKFIVINNAHNLFLSKYHGFNAFDAFFRVMNNSSHNVFWFTIWNSNSLNLIKHIYNKYELSSDTINIRPWTKDELRSLLLKRHEAIGTEIRFNEELFEIMSHFGAERSFDNASDIFFRILAKQTGGNPHAAVNTWLKSISYCDDKVLELHLPERRPTYEVESLSDETLFVLSSILSHELLNVDQIMATTDLSEKVVNFALKLGLEKGIIDKDDDSFHIRKDWLVDVKATLIKRNFIYE